MTFGGRTNSTSMAEPLGFGSKTTARCDSLSNEFGSSAIISAFATDSVAYFLATAKITIAAPGTVKKCNCAPSLVQFRLLVGSTFLCIRLTSAAHLRVMNWLFHRLSLGHSFLLDWDGTQTSHKCVMATAKRNHF